MSPQERLQKILASAGIASRRASEEIIRQGRVEVNGRVVTELGAKADPAVDDVRVDGIPLPRPEPPVYIMLHKPLGVLSTASDERGRTTVLDLVPVAERLYPVGRLDASSEGLILLTNDGPLTEKLTHPRYGHKREYRALVYRHPTEEELRRVRRGLILEDGPTGPAVAEVIGPAGQRRERLPPPDRDHAWLKIVIREGRKRQVRRMCEVIGHPVKRLIRVGMGPLSLGGLAAGKYRLLRPEEVEKLRLSVEKKQPVNPRGRVQFREPSSASGIRSATRGRSSETPGRSRRVRKPRGRRSR